MRIYLIRAFVEMREHLMANSEILKRLTEVAKSCSNKTMPCGIFTRNDCPFFNPMNPKPARNVWAS